MTAKEFWKSVSIWWRYIYTSVWCFGCPSDSSQHDRRSRFSGRCCPRMEQPTRRLSRQRRHIDFQATFN